ncbi:MAG: glycoside hydrolase family 15 protein [Bdellovibrionales bacterium]|nr:glycoside hydrolase family 15 protein [Oligoflexia bacterium]
MYAYGLIGNCQVSALVSEAASIDWLCLPRPDSPPTFGRLLDPEGGHFSVELISKHPVKAHQYYLQNTNVLVTELTSQEGDKIKVTDFCPRFEQHARMFRPTSLIRILEPLQGRPQIRVDIKPVNGWSKTPAQPTQGNSHLRFTVGGEVLRVLTNLPITYVLGSTPTLVHEPIYLALTHGSAIEEDLPELANRYLRKTCDYWRTWVKHCNVPSQYQTETIRSALALKLHCYEDTGAILAALTTSLPEETGHTRNWDYRYCWLRDTYFVLSAFYSLGHFEEMEGFLKFLLNLAQLGLQTKKPLAPVYTLDLDLPLPEKIMENWAGFANSPPVRNRNQAAEHVQNDVYGELVLALTPIFLDERFLHLRTPEHEQLLSRLVVQCAESIHTKDAGLWEIRDGWQEHSFTNLTAWAGLDRAKKIVDRGYLKCLPIDLTSELERARLAVEKAVKNGVLGNGPLDDTLDASLSLAATFRFPNAEVNRATVMKIYNELKLAKEHEGFFYRYKRTDDFGSPQSAFMICSFWVAQSLASLGELKLAKEVLDAAALSANYLGLLAEHFDPRRNLQLGNFPQAYSHVGMINAAFAISPKWSEVL